LLSLQEMNADLDFGATAKVLGTMREASKE